MVPSDCQHVQVVHICVTVWRVCGAEMNPVGGGVMGGAPPYDCSLDALHPVDMLASIQSRGSGGGLEERQSSRSLGLRDMMRCPPSAMQHSMGGRAGGGPDLRDSERDEMVISSISWPPDPTDGLSLGKPHLLIHGFFLMSFTTSAFIDSQTVLHSYCLIQGI